MNGSTPRPTALTIAGSDSGGGAGIQADLKTFSALGVYGMTAITAVTVQNTVGVSDYLALPPALVAAQIRSVAGDVGVGAAKTGMLAEPSIVSAVAEAVAASRIPNLVVDPVFVSKHGDPLLAAEAVDVLRTELLPLAVLVTPNLPEAEGLVGFAIATRDDMRRAATTLLGMGPAAVLVKGGHLESGSAADLFADADGERWLEAERIATRHTHGTGCTLSAAVAAHLAMGRTIREAAALGKAFVTEAIRAALPLGKGIGPVDQLWPIARPPMV
jgi:hydroxymethylpyrimidine/phosphomethylpyrimidine kinase